MRTVAREPASRIEAESRRLSFLHRAYPSGDRVMRKWKISRRVKSVLSEI